MKYYPFVLVFLLVALITQSWWGPIMMFPNGPKIEQEVRRISILKKDFYVDTSVFFYENHKMSTLEYWSSIVVNESKVDSVKNVEYKKAMIVFNKLQTK